LPPAGFFAGEFKSEPAISLSASVLANPAQSAASTIAGTWEGKTDGVPAITITIKEDGDHLSGSVTFYRIEDDGNGPTVTGKQTRDLINPKFDGKIFSYQVKGPSGEMIDRQMEITGKDEAQIKMTRVINGNTESVPIKLTRSKAAPPAPDSKQSAAQSHRPAPAITPPGGPVQGNQIKAIEAMLEDLVAKDQFSGVLLIADHGEPIFQKAVGQASKEYDVPNRLDTRFNLGSINKLFTQILIGQLAAEGKVALDDHLDKYLPDYPNRDAASKVTIRQLLNMKSGIGDFFGPEFQATPKDRIRDLKDYLPLFAAKPLLFPPGTKSQYSNGGYVVLGLVIEKVTSHGYYDWVKEKICEPLGMKDTGFLEADYPASNIASGYTRNGMDGNKQDHWRNNVYSRPARGSSAGGGYSTAGDLLKLAGALHSGKLIVPNFGAAVAGAPLPQRDPDGLGIAGGAPGINATMDTGVAGRYVVIVMSNYDPPSAMDVAKQVRRLLGQTD
jgi:CubicO group peptidase (beta-lactamase class C family)